MPAILFGSISTVADTSELQRQAFNQAFTAHGLDWSWDQEQYRTLLSTSGGRGRIADYAQSLGQTVDAGAVHDTKSVIFQESLATAQLQPRPGVLDAITSAKRDGWKLALVTTTSGDNVSALLKALDPGIQAQDFDVILDASSVEKPKPDPAVYALALERLHETTGGCVAIEDNIEGAQAAIAAGLACVAFPNENTAGHDIPGAARQVERVDGEELRRLAGGSR